MTIAFTDIGLSGDLLPVKIRYGHEVECELTVNHEGQDRKYRLVMDASHGIIKSTSKPNEKQLQARVANAAAMQFIRVFTDQPICSECGEIGPDVRKPGDITGNEFDEPFCDSCLNDVRDERKWRMEQFGRRAVQ